MVRKASNKENVLLFDVGTTRIKVAILKDGKFLKSTELGSPDNMYLNRVFRISERMLEKQKDYFGDTGVIGGQGDRFLTVKEASKIRSFAEEVPVLIGAYSTNEDIVRTAYKSLFDEIERDYDITLKEKDRKSWKIMVAHALTESTHATRNLGKMHEEILHDLGFSEVFTNNQVFFDILSQKEVIQEYIGFDNIVFQIVNFGGGDVKTCAITEEPDSETVKREQLGGQDVLNYAIKVFNETHPREKIYDSTIMQDWLEKYGNADGKAQRVKVNYPSDAEVWVEQELNAPAGYFEPWKIGLPVKVRSVVDILRESLSISREKGGDNLISDLLNCVLITGGGVKFGGVKERLERELNETFKHIVTSPENIHVVPAKNPVFSCLQGMKIYLYNMIRLRKTEEIAWVTA